MPTGRLQPYGMSGARPYKHRNAEAGPSSLVPPAVPFIDLPTPQPSGGISETTADAETTQKITEEDKVPVSDFYCSHIPHVTEWSFGVRHPNGPSAPAAKGSLVGTVSGHRKMPLRCAA